MKEKIGLLGGSFDPIHNGHLNLARELMDKLNLNEVWFCPTASNPLKTGGPSAGPADRLEMVKLAIEGESRFKLIDIEIKQNRPCYTIDTVRALRAEEAKKGRFPEFYLLWGDDIAHNFYKWKEPEAIIKEVHLVIGSRYGANKSLTFLGSPAVVKALKDGLVETNVIDISSTQVREKIRNALDCKGLVPVKVLDYIAAHHLYSMKDN